MKKLIFIAICAILNAETIDGIAIKVDGNIITIFEIDELQKSKKITRQKAVDELINEKLREN